MATHSSLVGGSTAGRLINCPGSFKATQALPPTSDIPSQYADEGTAMHAVMDRLMRQRAINIDNPEASPQYWLGRKFYDRELTQEHLDTMILPALDCLEDLEDHYGGRFRVAAVEMRVRFPGIPGAYGTSDLLLTSDTHALLIDWKFGRGVAVEALYKDDQGELLNPQLMYYLTSAMNTKPVLFKRRKLIIAIIQPRADGEPLTHTEVTRKDLQMFREDLENAVSKALDRNPPLQKGEWCRFAPCKIACPLWTGAITGLADLIEIRPTPSDAAAPEYTAYAKYLAKAKTLLDVAAQLKKEIDDQMHSFMEAGGKIPGWRLKPKTKMRQWIDENTVAETLLDLGFKGEEIWQEKLVTFQSADATARKKGVKIPDHLRVAPETNETTIAPDGDPAPVVDRRLATEEFSKALRLLRGESKL